MEESKDFWHLLYVTVYAIMRVRDDMGCTAKLTLRRYPFAVWLSCIVRIFGGRVLYYALLGKPIYDALYHPDYWYLVTLCWLLVFFFPDELVWEFLNYRVFRIAMRILDQMYRQPKYYQAIVMSHRRYPNCWPLQMTAALLEGQGDLLTLGIQRWIRGDHKKFDIFRPLHFELKTALIVSSIMLLNYKTKILAGFDEILEVILIIFSISSCFLADYFMKDSRRRAQRRWILYRANM